MVGEVLGLVKELLDEFVELVGKEVGLMDGQVSLLIGWGLDERVLYCRLA